MFVSAMPLVMSPLNARIRLFAFFLHERGCVKLHSVSSLMSRFEASVVVYMSEFRDFPGGPMVRTPRFYCRVPSLVGELRSNKPPKWLNKI